MDDRLLKLYIEPTSHCNLSCKMCFRETWIDESFMHMDMSVFYNALKTMPESVETVFFGGMGEPLFHPNIIEMITAVKNLGKNAELLTNGTLLRGEMISEILKANLDRLWISVDSLTPRNHGEHSGHDINITKKYLGIQQSPYHCRKSHKAWNRICCHEKQSGRPTLPAGFYKKI